MVAGRTGELAAVLSEAAVAIEEVMEAQPWLRHSCWGGFSLGHELGDIAGNLKALGSHHVDDGFHAERLEAINRAGELLSGLADEVEVSVEQVRRTIAESIPAWVRALELPEWQPNGEESEPLVEADRYHSPDFEGVRFVAIPGDGDDIEVMFPISGAMGNRALNRLAAEDERLDGCLVAEIRRQAACDMADPPATGPGGSAMSQAACRRISATR